MTIGEKIQLYRKQLKMSQDDLGQKLLVSRQTVSLWEKDQTLPSIDNLIRLSDIFRITVDDLLKSNSRGTHRGDPPGGNLSVPLQRRGDPRSLPYRKEFLL